MIRDKILAILMGLPTKIDGDDLFIAVDQIEEFIWQTYGRPDVREPA
ncbi:hypothetical protein SEA_KERBEROS_73 [Mycobacterium phage Kerberos]|uniref:Uncharacterized protein n=4 Tax=root TaxID=1 RepID=A0A2Z5XD37_BPMD2|nr:hypothetical protein M178_gp65 [Mycobacterium phage Chy5]YP_008060226.1 hypothetical protein M179_gp66 [Mycobacterium phage Chy4]AGK85832.1 hypothetical protein Chy1_0065 [Mycobacterium phage Chy1]APC43121.1 hypothetical protein SEA_KERBEROS_73 [Mycobacterium phage Kerberos]APC46189.1 hypothetical protein PBI_STARSTUFF_73 [Mycobacterium phage StarStuff]AXH48934.1 hypothetical protein SEA_TOMATHAN_73 [Mycobacterium phage Tomathan]QBP28731.1 hypothetical protein SEA_DBQU4N_73 [Mycobacterium 